MIHNVNLKKNNKKLHKHVPFLAHPTITCYAWLGPAISIAFREVLLFSSNELLLIFHLPDVHNNIENDSVFFYVQKKKETVTVQHHTNGVDKMLMCVMLYG